MGRAPCCEKMGLKKGPWTIEEDHILINHIKFYGHGLLRCGKSCRLRWINYLRPDIKRGNFTKEEEDTIVDLHEMLGNRWSAIAAKLPGRTDNEIKNIWHTHLKKKLKPNQDSNNNNNKRQAKSNVDSSKFNIKNVSEIVADMQGSPLESSSEASTETTSENNSSNNTCTTKIETREDVSEIDENLWSGVLSADNSSMGGDVQVDDRYLARSSVIDDYSLNLCDVDANLDFWYDVFVRVDDLSELPEI